MMKAAFCTLGCKVNSYETQAIKEQFFALGFEEAAFSEAADVYVVNTCSVTQIAERKSRQMISRARRLSPEAVIAATGCYVQEDPEKLINGTDVDLVVGNNEKSRLAVLAAEKLDEKRRSAALSHENGNKEHENAKDTAKEVYDLMHCREYEEQKISAAGDHVRAYIKIQDGCDRFCSYCIIPYLRGRSRSRRTDDIISEAKVLAANGYKEVVITGIDISSFEAPGLEKGSESLLFLIEKIAAVSGIKRIRLGSLECSVITANFLEGISRIPSFCAHFHLSLQSGSDDVLKRMNRRYTSQEYYEKVCLIRKYFPEAAICTDIIAGFPGESEEEFEATCAFLRKAGFSRTHVFKYSKRKGTRAADMPYQVDGNIKNLRSQRLIKITDELQREYEKRLIEKTVSVLFEEKTNDGYYTGFTREYVKIAAKSEEDLVNRIADVIPSGFADTKEGPLLYAEVK